jgi:hypothetical protein
MEIRIRKIKTQMRDGAPSDITNTYRVVDNGKEFIITFRSYFHGRRLGIAGEEGFLYRDNDSNSVRRQVIAAGPACGLSITSDETVEGLSPLSIEGVMIAEQRGETGDVILTTGGPEGSERVLLIVDGVIRGEAGSENRSGC